MKESKRHDSPTCHDTGEENKYGQWAFPEAGTVFYYFLMRRFYKRSILIHLE